jgi:hypothetical protein
MPRFVRYPLAVVAGAILGEVISLPVGVLLDIAFGHHATGGRWPLTIPNVILACAKGFITGYSAGWISKERGKLIGAFSGLFPFVCLIIFAIAVNRDFTVLWVWIALISAILGGHLGVEHGAVGVSYLASGMGFVSLTGFYTGCVALHVYTIVMAYHLSGLFSATITLAFPVISQLYWFVYSWRASGAFIDGYSIYFPILAVLLAFSVLMFGASALMNRKTSRES